MPQYTTSQEAMAAGVTTLETASIQIQGHIGALRCEVETMMGGWRGEAAASFRQVHEVFESQANKINAALRHMHQALLATHKTYGSQESNQTRTLSRLAGQMNG